ncbi:MAG: methyltransferase domain-containing protein [Candidatus Omnitrophica bacterium]|nr:methyltransferase domain-containing protein [Candidatus Omnitrophota bacterium]
MVKGPNKLVLDATRYFWDSNPCDGQVNAAERMKFKYAKEPWLPEVLRQISKHKNILEIGCGQGTDALYCCQSTGHETAYTGVDLSENSIKQAKAGVVELKNTLKTVPEFFVNNAEEVTYPDASFECVASLGVLHHTPDTQRAIDEVYRLLQLQGCAYISLYRKFSPKLLGAYTIRFLSNSLDRIFKKEKVLWNLLKRIGTNHFLGTMLLECVGVPVLRSYTASEIKQLFRKFSSIEVRAVGIGLFFLKFDRYVKITNLLGAQWLIRAVK